MPFNSSAARCGHFVVNKIECLTMKDGRPADRIFLLLCFILFVFGLVMLSSASAPVGYSKFGDAYYFIKRQVLFGVLPGFFLFLIFARVNVSLIKRLSPIFFILAVIALILVFVPGAGLAINGSRSWLSLFGYTFQSSEFAKLAIIIMLSKLLSDSDNLHEWKTGLLPILAIISPVIILIAAQPDVGTLSILFVIVFAMLYIGGAKKIHLAILGLLAIIGLAGLMFLAPYRVQRLTTFLHPELDPKGIGYQINQAYLAVGSGGLWGLGLSHSRQKFQYLPEVQADSIFAVVAEELGFVITAIVVLLIVFIGLRGFKIANGVQDRFSYLLVSGTMVWFVWQSFLNIASIIGLLPLTGVPLPFVSHGGSALLVLFMAIGIVANVSKASNYVGSCK